MVASTVLKLCEDDTPDPFSRHIYVVDPGDGTVRLIIGGVDIDLSPEKATEVVEAIEVTMRAIRRRREGENG